MRSPNRLELKLHFARVPFDLRMGLGDFYKHHSWSSLRHCNADYEVHIILAGTCSLDIDTKTYDLKKGDAVIITPGTFHYPHNMSEDFDRLTFSFMPNEQNFIQEFNKQIKHAAICSLDDNGMHICDLIFSELEEAQPFSEESILALFIRLLVVLFRGSNLTFSEYSNTASIATRRISIIDHFFSPWPDPFGTEDDLAQELNLSRRQLNRILLQYYGVGFREKMLRARMEYAVTFLRSTDMKIGEIASLVGYTAESSFYKAFLSYYQLTPQQYRKLNKDVVFQESFERQDFGEIIRR
ncbi:MAG: AraC family transcriptional regulator [Eubacteriales bacterium]|nr:AraC family transcriptional regulator [Eubacteriales bacterium]